MTEYLKKKKLKHQGEYENANILQKMSRCNQEFCSQVFLDGTFLYYLFL